MNHIAAASGNTHRESQAARVGIGNRDTRVQKPGAVQRSLKSKRSTWSVAEFNTLRLRLVKLATRVMALEF